MTAKSYLREYKRLLAVQKRIEREIETIEATIGGMTPGDGTPHGSGVSDTTGALAAELADMKKAYQIAQYDAWQKRKEIVDTINALENPTHARLLYDRYILFMRWEEVAADIYADESYTRGRLHGAALIAIDEIRRIK